MSATHRNIALKRAIFESGKQQQKIARLARVTTPDLSHAIHGRRDLDEDERQRLARVLGKSVEELFSAHDEAIAAADDERASA